MSTAATEQRVAFRDVVRTISLALEMDERGKLGHGVRVALLAHRIGEALGMPDAANLYYAGLLHDLGALGVADEVVHDAEHDRHGPEMRDHARRGAQIVRPLSALRPFEGAIRDHHERADGRGFPLGKRGAEIPLGASVVRLADQIDVALRRAPAEDVRVVVERTIARERAGGVPEAIADAAGDLVVAAPAVLALLRDPAALDDLLASFCPAPLGLPSVARHDLLSQLLWVLARVVDAKHSYTMGHSARVAYFGFRIAQAFSDEVNAWDVAWGGLLHDVGKVGISRRLLDKIGPLAPDEMREIRSHAAHSQRIIATIRDLAHLALPAAAHHERYDGAGYPNGLAGEAIPFVGRILAYADVYDALTTTRAYREAMPHAEALSRIRSMVGAHLDPNLAGAALDALQRWGHEALVDGRELSFARFFESDDADIEEAFGREAGVGTTLRSLEPTTSTRPALLLALEPWTAFRLTETMTLDGAPGALRELTGANGTSVDECFDAESARALADIARRLADGETCTRYLFTRARRPIEIVAHRDGRGVTLLCQSAQRRLQTMDRLALFYRNFLSSSEAIVFADPKGNIVDVNDSFVAMFGYARPEIVGKHTRMLRSGRQERPFYGDMWSAITDPTRGAWTGELVDRRRDGKEIDVRLSIEAVRDAAGTCIGYVAHMTDVTARNRAERELRRSRAELQKANEELQRVGRFKDELMAITSHDLRGPLGAIATLSALMRENLPRMPEEKVAAHLERIRETAARLTEFVSDLLDLDKSESGQLVLKPCRVRLDALLEQCVERVRAARTKRVRIELRLVTRPIEIVADAARAEQIFANLLTNAVKYSPEDETITIEAGFDAARGRCFVDVADRGPGVPPDALEAIFDRYYQVDRDVHRPGAGLGLHIVRNLVTLHRGSVRAENRAGGGCRFIVELPVGARADLERPVAVLLARSYGLLDPIAATLRALGAHVLAVESDERARAACALTAADLLVYEEGEAGGARDLPGAVERADGSRLPVVVGVWDAERAASATPTGRALVAPVLDSELRELLREAILRREGGAPPSVRQSASPSADPRGAGGRRRTVEP